MLVCFFDAVIHGVSWKIRGTLGKVGVFLSALIKRCEIIVRTAKASVIYAGIFDMY